MYHKPNYSYENHFCISAFIIKYCFSKSRKEPAHRHIKLRPVEVMSAFMALRSVITTIKKC